MLRLDTKNVAIIAVALILLGTSGFLLLNKDDDPTKTTPISQQDTEETIETSAFTISAPEGVSNQSENAETTGDISFKTGRPYGTLSVEIFTSQLQSMLVEENGTITSDYVLIDGIEAEQKNIDYLLAVSGESEEPLIRYSIRFDKVDKPSEDMFTKITINLMSTTDPSNEDIELFKQDAQNILDSIVIK